MNKMHLNQLNWPTDIFVDDEFSLYVENMNNRCVMKWIKDTKEGILLLLVEKIMGIV